MLSFTRYSDLVGTRSRQLLAERWIGSLGEGEMRGERAGNEEGPLEPRVGAEIPIKRNSIKEKRAVLCHLESFASTFSGVRALCLPAAWEVSGQRC